VISSSLMPEMDVPSFLEVIRSTCAFNRYPWLSWLAYADRSMIERARLLHINSILAKGKASPQDILHAVEAAWQV
jgi:hypothetical protein